MYRVQIILLDNKGRHSLGTYELSVMPRTGESMIVATAPEQKHVHIKEIIHMAYPAAKKPENGVDAILFVFTKPLTG